MMTYNASIIMKKRMMTYNDSIIMKLTQTQKITKDGLNASNVRSVHMKSVQIMMKKVMSLSINFETGPMPSFLIIDY